MYKHLFSISIYLIMFSAIGQEATTAHKDSLTQLVNEYYELNEVIFQKESTPDQIDSLFSLYTSDFQYVHEKYGGVYTRQDLYEGYLRNQSNGGYDGSVKAIEVVQMMAGLNAVAVIKRFILKEEPSEEQMTLFEFRNGKISRIVEYW